MFSELQDRAARSQRGRASTPCVAGILHDLIAEVLVMSVRLEALESRILAAAEIAEAAKPPVAGKTQAAPVAESAARVVEAEGAAEQPPGSALPIPPPVVAVAEVKVAAPVAESSAPPAVAIAAAAEPQALPAGDEKKTNVRQVPSAIQSRGQPLRRMFLH